MTGEPTPGAAGRERGDSGPAPPGDVRGTSGRHTWGARLLAGLGDLALLAVGIVLALGVGEGLVRWLRPQELRHSVNLYQPADSLGWVQRPGLDVRINSGEGPVRIITDRDGYRVGTDGRVEADTRVLLIGDSFLQAIEVAYESSLAGLLQADLPVRLRRPVAVRDGGVSGYTPSHYRLAAGRAFARETFDAMLVAVYSGNDIVPARVASYEPSVRSPPLRPRRPRSWTPREFNRSVTMPLMLRALRHSHLAVLAWNGTELLRTRLGMQEYQFPTTMLMSHAEGPEWDVTADLCAEIAAVGTRHGASVLFVVIPQYFQMAPELAAAHARANALDAADVDADQPNTRLAERMRARGLTVLDALGPMRASWREGGSAYGRINRHLGPAGHAALRDLVEPWLVEELGRRARPARP
jgi:hypothetical protein